MNRAKHAVSSIRKSSREIVHEFGLLQQDYTPVGLSHAQCHALIEIEQHGVSTAKELTAALCLDKSTVSRMLTKLANKRLIKFLKNGEDLREKHVRLNAKGVEKVEQIHKLVNARVLQALNLLTAKEVASAVAGLELYAKALEKSRVQNRFNIRQIRSDDNLAITRIIRAGMKEFGAVGSGFASEDTDLNNMYTTYRNHGASYFVAEQEKRVVGGGGITALEGGPSDVCELRKMFLIKEVRGLGLGSRLLESCLNQAKALGYKRCYLETVESMQRAIELYKDSGFQRLKKPMGTNRHYNCQVWYVKDLTTVSNSKE